MDNTNQLARGQRLEVAWQENTMVEKCSLSSDERAEINRLSLPALSNMLDVAELEFLESCKIWWGNRQMKERTVRAKLRVDTVRSILQARRSRLDEPMASWSNETLIDWMIGVLPDTPQRQPIIEHFQVEKVSGKEFEMVSPATVTQLCNGHGLTTERLLAARKSHFGNHASVPPAYEAKIEPFQAFVSHDWNIDGWNHDRVREMVRELESRGVRVWFDEDRLQGGDQIIPKLVKGLDQATAVLVIVTQNYMDKVNSAHNDLCKLEFFHAYRSKPGKLIPIIFDEALRDQKLWSGPVGATLGQSLYVDLSVNGPTGALESLTNQIR